MLRIGNVSLDNNIILAPMAGITDLAFRLTAKEFGAGLVCSEMISAKGLFYKDKNTNLLLQTCEAEHPLSIQIFGSEPDMIAYACENIKDAAIIDINMGCPARKIVSNGDGGALMKSPRLMAELVRAAVKVASVPVTVKMRIGWDDDSINVTEAAKMVEDAGAAAITVHGRTVKQEYRGLANWEKIKEVKKAVSIPIIGNGDITSPEIAVKRLEETHCDGIMIGRGVLGRPWLIGEILAYQCSKAIANRTMEERYEAAKKHISLIVKFKGERTGIKEARKHALWYLKGLPHAARVKDQISRAKTLDEMLELLTVPFLLN